MNSLDLTVLIIMSIAITMSTFRGGVREIFSLTAVVIGFILAAHYYQAATDHFIRPTSYPSVNNVISFLAIYIFTAVLISFVGGRITKIVKKSRLNVYDVILGTVIGLTKGIVISLLLTYALMVFLPADSRVFTDSKSFPYLSQASRAVAPIGPKFFREEFNRRLDELKAKKTLKKFDRNL